MRHIRRFWPAFQVRSSGLGGALFWFALGYLCSALPSWLYRSASVWYWPVLSGLAMLLFAVLNSASWRQAITGTEFWRQQSRLLVCSLAISISLLVDFSMQAPDVLLAMCSSKGSLLEDLQFHLFAFPFTSACMALLVWHQSGQQAGTSRCISAWHSCFASAVFLLHLTAMFFCMLLTMRLTHLLQLRLSTHAYAPNLSADAVAGAMLVGMLGYHVLALAMQALLARLPSWKSPTLALPKQETKN